ncbi:tripartite tricarboxylate transporter substrate binding protein [Ottowia thiooxydans]|uniref:tripartite tricarboxylate transporter substrate binding protein n=1 Tax=Ottowia thiooxydans TaxID=219182 RepID=UPI0004183EE8|nr:tripartite tricarboxylate transporter substrate binding protein [Ottowia thiooxydans]
MISMIYRIVLVITISLTATLVSAQDQWPAREVAMTVNFGAGGNTDAAARIVSREIAAKLGKPVVVVNKGGAQGTLGPSLLAKYKPDGYNIGVVTFSSVAMSPHLMNLNYSLNDFDYLGAMGKYRYGLITRGDSPIKTLAQMIDAAKTGQGLFYGTSSPTDLIALSALSSLTGAKLQAVPYKSGSDTVLGLLAGDIVISVQNPSEVIEHIKTGKLRLLASLSDTRWSEFPEIATAKEQGYDVAINSYVGIAAPKALPLDIKTRLESIVMASIREKSVQNSLRDVGFDPIALDGNSYKSVLEQGYKSMGAAIQAAKIPRIQ